MGVTDSSAQNNSGPSANFHTLELYGCLKQSLIDQNGPANAVYSLEGIKYGLATDYIYANYCLLKCYLTFIEHPYYSFVPVLAASSSI